MSLFEIALSISLVILLAWLLNQNANATLPIMKNEGNLTTKDRHDIRVSYVDVALKFIATGALIFTLYASIVTMQQGQAGLELQQEGQTADQYVRLTEMLSSNDQNVRVAAIHGLAALPDERPLNRSVVAQVLAAFLRQRPAPDIREYDTGTDAVSFMGDYVCDPIPRHLAPEDINTAVSYLADKSWIGNVTVGLRNTDLRGLNLEPQASFAHFDLQGSDFSGGMIPAADFTGTNLAETRFIGSCLPGSHFSGTNAVQAMMIGADMRSSVFELSDFRCSVLSVAVMYEIHAKSQVRFDGAWMEDARLAGAKLGYSTFFGANLGRVFLRGVSIEGTNLQGANDLSVEQIEGALVNKQTKFPILLDSTTAYDCSTDAAFIHERD